MPLTVKGQRHTKHQGQINVLFESNYFPPLPPHSRRFWSLPSQSAAPTPTNTHGQIWLFATWPPIWMTICLTCFLSLETGAAERREEWSGLFELGRGSCSFFAWVALREARYLADDECLGALSCVTTPADLKTPTASKLSAATSTSGLQPQPVLQRNKSMAATFISPMAGGCFSPSCLSKEAS